MDFWFEKGRPAIFKALTQVCDQIDSELLSELSGAQEARRNGTHPEVSGPLESVKSNRSKSGEAHEAPRAQPAAARDVGNDDVAHKTVAFEGQPVTRGHPSSSTLVPPLSSGPSVPDEQQRNYKTEPPLSSGPSVPDEQQRNYKTEYANLSARFNALSENFKKAKAALEKRKDERDRWIQHANHLESRIRAAESEHNIKILERGHSVEGHVTRPPIKTPSPAQSFIQEPDHAGEVAEEPMLPLPDPTKTSANGESVLPDSTQGEPEDELPPLIPSDPPANIIIKQEPSSDAPVVVSERALRKRKREDTTTDAATSRKIKTEEPGSSSPIVRGNTFKFSPQESIDLGETSGIMSTPRKPKDSENSRVPQPRNENMASVRTPAPLMVRPDGFPQTTRPTHFNSALTPISVNRRVTRSGGDKPAQQPLKKGLGHGIGVLAENGAVYEAEPPAPTPTGTRLKAAAKGKLEAMLNNAISDDERAGAYITPRQRRVPGTPRDELHVPARRQLPFDKNQRASGSREKTVALTATSKNIRHAQSPAQKTDASRTRKREDASILRNKPLSELRLDDFKVNPLVNDGEDFAFSEVVRNKADRACLPGCTDMLCCGKQFRALAISQRPNPPLTPAQREEEQKLLEDYLGDYAYRLRDMGEEERMELWVEAKTQELANKYGKHRHRFSRMQSPPGFWNADFPSTQELEADRSEASKREQAAIKERHREAMRPGGRWLFRDEQPTFQ